MAKLSSIQKNINRSRLIKKLSKDNSFNKKDYEIINFGIGGLRSIHHYFTIKKNRD